MPKGKVKSLRILPSISATISHIDCDIDLKLHILLNLHPYLASVATHTAFMPNFKVKQRCSDGGRGVYMSPRSLALVSLTSVASIQPWTSCPTGPCLLQLVFQQTVVTHILLRFVYVQNTILHFLGHDYLHSQIATYDLCHQLVLLQLSYCSEKGFDLFTTS